MSSSKPSNADFGAIEKSVLPEMIAEKLLSLIREKQLLPGTRLPPERELAATMKVSRPSLREALRVLSAMKVIEIRQGSGTYVSSLAVEELIEHMDFVFSLNDSTYLELLEARKVLEVGIVGIVAERMTDAEILDLEAHLEKSAGLINDQQASLEADLEFHDRIITACHNSILIQFMKSVRRLSLAGRYRTYNDPKSLKKAVRAHRLVVKALKARNPDLARLAMYNHIDHVIKTLKGLVPPDDTTFEED